MSKRPAPTSPLAPLAFPALPEVRGVRGAAGRLGLYATDRDDLIALAFDAGASVAGAFTRSQTRSADVDWCRRALAEGAGRASALVCNAGNSNAFTGPAGLAKNAATRAAVQALNARPEAETFLAATGVIGQPLAADRLAQALPGLWSQLAPPDWERLARAIMTTDTFPKGAGAQAPLGGVTASVAGIAKGSGMIAPNMATMLVFIFTDAAIAPQPLQAIVSALVDRTFNCITVDGDTSTSDTLLVFATGASGAANIDTLEHPDAPAFAEALEAVMADLAMQVVRDGEGAQKLIHVTVAGAESDASARRIALSIANSPLVKTAVAGGDANWGRVVMAIGKAGEPIALEALSVRMGGVWTAVAGGVVPYDEAAVDAHFAGRQIDIEAIVGDGPGRAIVHTCDLTKGYIEINGDYRS